MITDGLSNTVMVGERPPPQYHGQRALAGRLRGVVAGVQVLHLSSDHCGRSTVRIWTRRFAMPRPVFFSPGDLSNPATATISGLSTPAAATGFYATARSGSCPTPQARPLFPTWQPSPAGKRYRRSIEVAHVENHREANRRLACILGASLATAVITGCGAGVGDVTGTVTCGNKTLASGTVVIRGSDMIPYHGNIDEDGNYTVSKVPTGPATIVVVSMNPQVSVHPAAFDDRDMMKASPRKSRPQTDAAQRPEEMVPHPPKIRRFQHDRSDAKSRRRRQ